MPLAPLTTSTVVLVLPASPGAREVVVSNEAGFAIGETVELTSGGFSETHTIVGFGTIVLEAPLVHAFPAGSIVMVGAPAPAPQAQSVGAGAPAPAPQVGTSNSGTVIPMAPTQGSAVGDPHMVNVRGQRFDLMQPGVHALLHLPMQARPSNVLLRVDADAQQVGGACADTYFMSVNITGKWVEAKVHALGQIKGRGLYYTAGSGAAHTGTKWMSFGTVRLKVVHGRTAGGTPYLNFFVRNLKSAGCLVGGLLGEDDHAEAETPTAECRRVYDV